MRRYFPNGEPIGNRLWVEPYRLEDVWEVVGVVAEEGSRGRESQKRWSTPRVSRPVGLFGARCPWLGRSASASGTGAGGCVVDEPRSSTDRRAVS